MNLITAILPAAGAIQAENLILAATGYTVVFFALLLLYFAFRFLPNLLAFNLKRKLIKTGEPEKARQAGTSVTGEVNAAIAMAVYLYLHELHDHENAVLTIKKAARIYSPWSSKIYNVIHFRGR